ncbi:hypothetical protein DFJ74DRAFT_755531 [Hyaloraphidium curvatum]|nr:hypothetical protein DFJ74DRAFT_775811 [Hyaloraphidium curvatum]KAI9026033.1 hypothetical protein DFJ74DRAFT_755531 [Hyaloraphidium curvatum]
MPTCAEPLSSGLGSAASALRRRSSFPRRSMKRGARQFLARNNQVKCIARPLPPDLLLPHSNGNTMPRPATLLAVLALPFMLAPAGAAQKTDECGRPIFDAGMKILSTGFDCTADPFETCGFVFVDSGLNVPRLAVTPAGGVVSSSIAAFRPPSRYTPLGEVTSYGLHIPGAFNAADCNAFQIQGGKVVAAPNLDLAGLNGKCIFIELQNFEIAGRSVTPDTFINSGLPQERRCITFFVDGGEYAKGTPPGTSVAVEASPSPAPGTDPATGADPEASPTAAPGTDPATEGDTETEDAAGFLFDDGANNGTSGASRTRSGTSIAQTAQATQTSVLPAAQTTTATVKATSSSTVSQGSPVTIRPASAPRTSAGWGIWGTVGALGAAFLA